MAIIVPRREKENKLVYGKGASAATGQWPSWGGDRGPLLGKQEVGFPGPTGHPPASRPCFLQFSSFCPHSCLFVYPLVCLSLDSKVQVSALGHCTSWWEVAPERSSPLYRHLPPTPGTSTKKHPLGVQLWAELGAQQATRFSEHCLLERQIATRPASGFTQTARSQEICMCGSLR